MVKNVKYITAILSFTFICAGSKAQDEDMLKLLGPEKPKKEIVKNAFKSPRVIMGQSVEFLRPGTMDFRILHRFGQLNQGYKNFFGLDQASMRMGFDFGIMKNLQVGIGRSTFNKELDAYFKYAPFQQSTGKGAFPVTIALVSGITMTGTDWADPSRKNYFTSRLGYFFQAVIGGRVTDGLSLQVTPTVIHRNLVKMAVDSNDIYAAGFGGRLRLSRRISLTWDYFYVLNPLTDNKYQNPVGIGFDIETGGHVFQLHFTNATGMNEKAFITETTGDLLKGEIRFGFNLSRVFQIKKKKTE